MPESPQPSRLVYCYPVRLAIPTPTLPRVELHFENDVACLRFRGEMVKVNRGHFSKLVRTDCSSVAAPYFERCNSLQENKELSHHSVWKSNWPVPSHLCPQELLYRYSCIDDPRFEKFLSRVWCLLKRYQVSSTSDSQSALVCSVPHGSCVSRWCLAAATTRGLVCRGHCRCLYLRR